MTTDKLMIGYAWVPDGKSIDGLFIGNERAEERDVLVMVQPLKQKADALIYASAPELLEALEKLCDAMYSMTCHPGEVWPKEWEAAQAAIAKATGEPT